MSTENLIKFNEDTLKSYVKMCDACDETPNNKTLELIHATGLALKRLHELDRAEVVFLESDVEVTSYADHSKTAKLVKGDTIRVILRERNDAQSTEGDES